MSKHFLQIAPVILAASVVTGYSAGAQTFKVEKFSIGGDGGTDYLTAERNESAQRLFVRAGFRATMIEMTRELND